MSTDICNIKVSESNSYVFSSVRKGDLVIRMSANEAGLHAGYTAPESNAILSVTKELFQLGGNNSNVSISNNQLQIDSINFTGSLTQNGTPFVSGSGGSNDASNITSGILAVERGGTGTSNSTGTGSIVLSSNPTLEGTISIGGHILPTSTLVYDLGSSNSRWRDLYLSGSTINLGGVQLTADSNNNFMVMDSNDNLKTIVVGELQMGQSSNSSIFMDQSGQIGFKASGSNVVTMCNTMVSINTNLQVGAPLNLQGLKINRRGGNVPALNVSIQPQFLTVGCNIYVGLGSNLGIGTTTPTQALDVIGNIATGGVVRLTSAGVLQNVTTDASNITTGLLSTARGGTGTSNVTGTGSNVFSDSPTFTGTVTAATLNATTVQTGGTTRITNTGVLQNVTTDASNITTGLLSTARGGTGTSNVTGTGSNVFNNSPTFIGTVTAATINATTLTGNGAGITTLNAANVSSGTLPVARGGTGTTSSTGTGSVVLNSSPTLTNLTTSNVINIAVPNDSNADSGTIGLRLQRLTNSTPSNGMGSFIEFSTARFASTLGQSSARIYGYIHQGANSFVDQHAMRFSVYSDNTVEQCPLTLLSSEETNSIFDGGLVGIGTSNPIHRLDVYGTIATNGVARIGSNGILQNVTLDASNITMGLLSTARGGTGTSNVTGASNLVLSHGPTFTGTLTINNSGSNKLRFENDVSTNRHITLYEDVNNEHQFYGLGINNTMLRYQISSSVASHAFYAASSSTTSTELMRIKGNGFVGIGTSTPTQKLDVNGNMILGTQSSPGYISAGNLGMFRNRIINGDMKINQRGANSVVIGASAFDINYCLDRWRVESSISTGGLTLTSPILTSSDLPFQQGFTRSFRVTASTANTSYSWILPSQSIEGLNMVDLMWGTSYGVSITVSFWFKTNLANGSVLATTIRNDNGTYSYNASFTVSSTGSWQFVNVTIPAPPSGSTWNKDNTLGAQLFIAGYETPATANTWQNLNRIGLTTNPYSVINNYIEFTGVQLEKGTIATPFEFRPYSIELELCQRYFKRYGGSAYYYLGSAITTAGQSGAIPVFFSPTMRASPTVSKTNGLWRLWNGSEYGITLTTILDPANGTHTSTQMAVIGYSPSNNTLPQGAFFASAYNDASAYVDFSSEL